MNSTTKIIKNKSIDETKVFKMRKYSYGYPIIKWKTLTSELIVEKFCSISHCVAIFL
jgi:hypothetical protein